MPEHDWANQDQIDAMKPHRCFRFSDTEKRCPRCGWPVGSDHPIIPLPASQPPH